MDKLYVKEMKNYIATEQLIKSQLDDEIPILYKEIELKKEMRDLKSEQIKLAENQLQKYMDENKR